MVLILSEYDVWGAKPDFAHDDERLGMAYLRFKQWCRTNGCQYLVGITSHCIAAYGFYALHYFLKNSVHQY